MMVMIRMVKRMVLIIMLVIESQMILKSELRDDNDRTETDCEILV